ncbi:phenylacetate--CoA ligase family protein [Virgibacillus alimentarius]|uniref:phenylacetate--CoA ligase family protein n=1 Tax=Virgibacillus alimentarius TaxID=698769 RepID=UPI0018DC067E|nr:phenylacetate--CoA ligase [Virgibacillus alimentarius]
MFNKEIETLERNEMDTLQLSRLQETVERVYQNVEFYKKKFDELHLKPNDIKSIEDIKKLPFTVKSDLRDHYPYGLFATPMEDIIRLHASSGTSGKPTVVAYTENDIDNWAEIVARSITAAGGSQNEVMHNAYGYGLFTGGLGLHDGGEKLGITTVPVSGGNTNRQILLLEDLKPQVICSTPSYALHIAEVMEEQGKDPRKTNLKYGIFGSEPWSEEMRNTLEEKFDIKAVDIYGLSEVVGPGVAIECHEEQDGLHIQEDHFFVEVIDPDTLETVPDGEEGELVFTSLTKEAFPVIRYRTGDIATITRKKCNCGRTTVRMSRVKGRIDDMLIIRGVNVFPFEMERSLLQMKALSPHYQIHLKKDGAMDAVELQVELSEPTFHQYKQDINHENIGNLKDYIQSTIKDECLVSVDVTILPPKSIPRSEGKAVRVVDQRTEHITQ